MKIVNVMSKYKIIIIIIACLSNVFFIYGQTLKIASPVPESTPWGQALNQIAQEWEQISNGKVKLRIYSSGIAGNERDSIKKMRVRQLQGVVLTSIGMREYFNDIYAFSTPLLMKSNAEFQYLVKENREEMNKAVRANRGELIFVAPSGWTYLFSKQQINEPSDFLRVRFGVTDPRLSGPFESIGLNVALLNATDLLSSLNSNYISAFANSPLLAYAGQYFGVANNMLNLPIAPFVGALVIDARAWARIPAAVRTALLNSIGKHEETMTKSSTQLELNAIKDMQNYGLQLQTPNAQQIREWNELFAAGREDNLGILFSEKFYNKLVKQLAAYRK